MGRRDRVPACLLRQVLIIRCLAAAMIWRTVFAARAQDPPSAGAVAASRLTGYDPSNGVAIRNSQPYQWRYEPAGIAQHSGQQQRGRPVGW